MAPAVKCAKLEVAIRFVCGLNPGGTLPYREKAWTQFFWILSCGERFIEMISGCTRLEFIQFSSFYLLVTLIGLLTDLLLLMAVLTNIFHGLVKV